MKNSLLSFVLILLINCVFLNISAQKTQYVDYSNSMNYIIKDIQVTGVKYLQITYLINISGLSVGQEITIPGEAITDAIDKFWELGLFSDVKIFATQFEGRQVSLEIKLTEQPRLSKLKIEGIRKGEIKNIEEKIKLKPGNQLTENVLNNTETIIKKHFIDKGFFRCNVDFVQKADTSPGNRVFLDIMIDKGKRIKISDIDFVGNQVFKDSRLRKTMKKTKQRSINIFKPSKYIDAEFKEDKKKFIAFYNKHGYRDAKILEEKLIDKNRKRIGLELKIEEGNKYYVRNIAFVGNTKHTSESLSRVFGMKKGDIYDQEFMNKRLIEEDDAILSQYMDEGYLFASVDPVEINVDGDSIDLEIRVVEGEPANIDRILIKGNTKTNEHVIRREIRTIPGDLFSRTYLIRTVRELAAMGHFNPENVTPNVMPNTADNTVDIEYILEERSNDQLEVSGGWGGYGFVGTIGIRFSNFAASKLLDLKSWRPVPTGDGQTLSLRAQSNGRFYQAYNLSFVEPWFGGKKPNSFSTSFYYTITHPYRNFGESRSSAYFKVLGTSVGLGKKLLWPDDYFVLYGELGYQRYMLNNYGSSFVIENGVSQIFDMNLTLSRSSQDQMIYPRQGSSFSLSVKFTPPYSLFKKENFWSISANEELRISDEGLKLGYSGDGLDKYIAGEKDSRESSEKFKFIEYHKWKFNGAWYTRLGLKDLVLATKAEFGYLGFYNPKIGTSPFEKFDVGGSGMMGYNLYGTDIVALRGYAEGSLTPTRVVTRNGSDVQINDGNVYVKYTVELRYPFSLKPSATIFGLVFLEAGNAWTRIQEFDPFGVKRSVGIGLRAALPMFGMLGIDYGYGFDMPNSNFTDKDRRGRHGGEIHFTMGQQF